MICCMNGYIMLQFAVKYFLLMIIKIVSFLQSILSILYKNVYQTMQVDVSVCEMTLLDAKFINSKIQEFAALCCIVLSLHPQPALMFLN